MPEKVTIIYHEISNLDKELLENEKPVEIGSIFDTVLSVKHSLIQLGYTVDLLELKPPITTAEEALNNLEADIIFNLFEGFDGWPESEAAIVAHMENIGLCFTGSPSQALRFCGNKVVAKKILKANNIPTPEGKVFHPCRPFQYDLNFPCIVKPLGEHASYGITENSVVKDSIELRKQIEYVWENFRHISLVEEFLPGREFRALIIGTQNLKIFPVEEIIYSLPPGKPDLLTFAAKWLRGDEYFTCTREQCPAEAISHLKSRIEHLALKAYTALGCQNYASVDLRLNEDGQVMVIDINPNTDISRDGGVRFPLEACGMDYTSFIEEIVQLARESNQYHFSSQVKEIIS